LYIGLAVAKPVVLSAVGGFREVAEDHGAGRLVPPGDPAALAAAMRELLDDPAKRAALSERAAAAAAGPFSWEGIARRTLGLYEELRR
ncbi:MAG: glycosyltransferase, partial [Thermoleophilaceae bacterium]